MTTLGFDNRSLGNTRCAVTIGVFDGMHLGHRKVLETTVRTARELGCKSLAISFSRNPKMVGRSMPEAKPLQSFRIMEESLINIGIDYHCVIDFSKEMSKLTGVEFLAMLCRFCRVGAVLVGSDFRCGNPTGCVGADRIGDVLRGLSIDVPVFVVDPVLDSQGRVISSTLIRSMLLKGDVAGSAALLGRPYCLDMRGVPLMTDRDGLLTKADSFVELLPMAGEYGASALAEDGISCAFGLSISGSCLSLQLPDSAKIDRIFLFSRSNQDGYQGNEG